MTSIDTQGKTQRFLGNMVSQNGADEDVKCWVREYYKNSHSAGWCVIHVKSGGEPSSHFQ